MSCEKLLKHMDMTMIKLKKGEEDWHISIMSEILEKDNYNCYLEYWLSQPQEDIQICIKKIKAKIDSQKKNGLFDLIENIDIESFLQEGIDTYHLYLEAFEG